LIPTLVLVHYQEGGCHLNLKWHGVRLPPPLRHSHFQGDYIVVDDHGHGFD
jgi:hypothetical protein